MIGRSESSSSECDTDIESSATVASVTKESGGTVEGGMKRPVCNAGDDSGNL